MEFIIDGKLVEKEQEEKNCKHEITVEKIGNTIYRYCKHCGMVAHEDGSYAYACGSDYCRCMA